MILTRPTQFRCLILLAILGLSLKAPTLTASGNERHPAPQTPTRTAPATPSVSCPVSVVDEDDAPASTTASLQERVAQTLLATMLRSYASLAPKPKPKPKVQAVPPAPIPLVVLPPIAPADYTGPKQDGPGFPAENPNQVPEPGSLVTGIVGAGLALAGWARHRRRLRGSAPLQAQPA